MTQATNQQIDLGYYPRKWKMASIVILRKSGKPDYSVPEAYRPISLLNTLGKIFRGSNCEAPGVLRRDALPASEHAVRRSTGKDHGAGAADTSQRNRSGMVER